LTAEEKVARRIGPSTLAPVLFTLVVAMAFAIMLGASNAEIVPLAIFPDGGSGALFNALFFVVAIAGVGLLVYLLVRRRAWRLLRLIIATAFTLVALMLSYLYISSALDLLGRRGGVLLYASSLLATAFVVYGVFFAKGRVRVPVVLVFGASLGAFLGASIPMSSGVFILVFLALYDILSVYKGPVGRIVAEADPNQIRGLSVVFRSVQIGLGDLVFYSMLVSEMILGYGVVPSLFSMLGVLVGTYLGFKVLERRRIFPGLPLSLAFGLSLGFLAVLL